MMDQLFDKCFPNFAKAVVQGQINEAFKLINPTAQAKQSAELVKSLVSQAPEVRRLVSATLASQLSLRTFGQASLTTATPRATQTLSAGGLPDTALSADGYASGMVRGVGRVASGLGRVGFPCEGS